MVSIFWRIAAVLGGLFRKKIDVKYTRTFAFVEQEGFSLLFFFFFTAKAVIIAMDVTHEILNRCNKYARISRSRPHNTNITRRI